MLSLMQSKANWVVWNLSSDRKIPLDAKTLKYASSTDPTTWSALDIALERTKEGFGLGFVLDGSGIVAIDIDDCIDEKGNIDPVAQGFIRRAIRNGAYVEVSPSGRGIHIIYYGTKDFSTCRFRFGEMRIEIYDKARYITYTGNTLSDNINDHPDAHKSFSDYINTIARIYDDIPFDHVIETLLADTRSAALYRGDTTGYDSHSEADLALVNYIAQICENIEYTDIIFRSSGLYRRKWDEYRGKITYGELTLRKVFGPQGDETATENHGGADDTTSRGDGLPLTEYGNALRILLIAGEDHIYDRNRGKWIKYNGVFWEYDEKEGMDLAITLLNRLDHMARMFAIQAAKRGTKSDEKVAKEWRKWAKRSQSKRVIDASLKLAARIDGRTIEWDKDPHLINTPDGVVDLENGKMYEHKREYYMRMCTAVRPSDEEPTMWTSFLRDITGGDDEMVSFLKRLLGYALIAGNVEQKFFILWGPGGNGKTTMMNVIQSVLGTYAAATQPETFVARMNSIPSDIARLDGKRFIVTSEPAAKGSLNAALVKRVTGGDTILVRFMFKEWFEMRVVGTPYMTTNVQPTINDTDDGIWRRIVQVPIEARIDPRKMIPGLDQKLFTLEGNRILGWLIQGAREYLDGGLGIPERVRRATERYRLSQDTIGIFFDEVLERTSDQDTYIPLVELQMVYSVWCKLHGMRPVYMRRIAVELASRKRYPFKDNAVWGYKFSNSGLRMLEMTHG